jgi:hypothetical protein
MIWLLSPPLPSVSSTGETQETEKERQLADGGGGGYKEMSSIYLG